MPGYEHRPRESGSEDVAGILIPTSGCADDDGVRGCPLLRSAATAGLVGVAVDPDDRKDQDGPQAIARSAIAGRDPGVAKPHPPGIR